MRKSTEELLLELKAGSYKAFNVLYETYFDLLYGYVFGLIRSHSKTEEIAQDAFIKVWLNRSQINAEYSFKAWLFRIAKNQLVDNFKKQLAEPLFEDYLYHCENESGLTLPEQDFDFELFASALKKAKLKLSPRQLEVFELCKEEGLSSAEVADKLNISKQVVWNYLSQALELLRKEMKDFSFTFSLFFLT